FQEQWESDCSRKQECAHNRCGADPPRAAARYYFLALALAAAPGAAGTVAVELRLGCAFGAAGRVLRPAAGASSGWNEVPAAGLRSARSKPRSWATLRSCWS